MWTLDNFPSADMARRLGWAPDAAWLDRVMGGVARLPGCSGANVSGEGLVLTNHHCVINCIEALSGAGVDYIANGFAARTRAQERRCPNTSISVLQSIEDVTARIDEATSGVAAAAFAQARNAEIARLESSCADAAESCEVVTLHQGGRYALYRYRRYDDVRLVFAPEHAMAAFGGDADNFDFPRYCADFAFVRLYENSAPAATPRRLRMRFSPLAADEIVLAAGNPGATSRLRSVAELSFEREVGLPWRLALLREQRVRLLGFSAVGVDQARRAAPALQSVENSLKGLTGRLEALNNAVGFAQVIAGEQDLRARVRRNRAAMRESGQAWVEIERAQQAHRAIFVQYQLLEARAGERSEIFLWARDLVRGAAASGEAERERLPRYTEARMPIVLLGLRAQRVVDPALEALHLALWLENVATQLPGAQAQSIFGGETPQALAQRLAQSLLADAGVRAALWDGGEVAIAASDDPMLIFVRALEAHAGTVRERYVQEVEGPTARASERIARARFRAFGESRYPDATFSPRLTYGRVAGWREPGGESVGPFTVVDGLFERATGVAPYRLTQRWADARSRLDPNMVFNLTTTHDAIGGSSGSPILDREGRVAGVLFDGNRHALAGEYYYDLDLNRSIGVAAVLMRAALLNVYDMPELVAELEGAPL